MLIGIDASRAVMSERTGTENYSLFLIRALLNLDTAHRFRLYTSQEPASDLLPEDERVELRVMPFPRLWTHLRLSWEMLRHPPDVLFVPAHVLPFIHPKSVATVHDLGYLHHASAHRRLARWYLGWGTRFTARQAKALVVDSRSTRTDLAEHYHVARSHIHVIYPAGAEGIAPVTDGDALAAVAERHKTGDSYVLSLGTIQPRKNLITLIDAFSLAHRTGALAEGTRLVLAGRLGWLSDDIVARAAAPDVLDLVVMPGYVPQKDVPALMSGASAFVFPSLYEGFGLPVLEAMACGTPVGCSKSSSLPEVAGSAAYMVEPLDVAGWAEALKHLTANEALRTELVQRGFRQAAEFTWERCAAQVLEVIESVGRM